MCVLLSALGQRVLIACKVASTVAEMSSDAAAKLWDENLTKRLFDIIHSTNIVDQTGGLLAIGAWTRPPLHITLLPA